MLKNGGTEKIFKSLDIALNYYNNSIIALKNKDMAILENCLWHMLSELEYILFLLSISFDKEKYQRRLPRQDEIKNIKVNMQLNEAKQFILENRIFEAYKNIYEVKYYVRKIYNIVRKKFIYNDYVNNI
jgi:hypothetical protein